jgi:hypothetical protein
MDFFIKGWRYWPVENGQDGSNSLLVNYEWPTLPQVPVMQRRRLSPLTKIAFDVAFSQEITATAPMVFASRHGDLHKTLELLRDVVQQQPLSPTQFALSVHNAIAGQFSIFTQHQAEHSSVSAGDSTLHFAVMEAVAMLDADDCPEVLVVYADQPVPDVYKGFTGQPAVPVAMALLISINQGMAVSLRHSAVPVSGADAALTADEADLLHMFLQSGATNCSITASRACWQWQRRTHEPVS